MWKKGLIASVVILVVGMALNMLLGVVFPNLAAEYQNPALFRPWTDPLMMLFFAYPFITGFVLAYLWSVLGKWLTGSPTSKAWQFAKLYFVVATIPGMFISWTSFQVSPLMIASWTIVGLVEAFAAGFVFTKFK